MEVGYCLFLSCSAISLFSLTFCDVLTPEKLLVSLTDPILTQKGSLQGLRLL